MKKRLLSVAVLLFGLNGYAQVGIGTTDPNKSSQLDVISDNKGVLIPRVSLQNTSDATTISNGNVNSLLVFNTSTQNDVIPGYYYWFENSWKRIINETDIQSLDTNTTNTSFTILDGSLYLNDSDGNTVSIPLSQINSPETVTTLVNNNNGTYTYTNEAGNTVTIDVPADVINNFEEIVTNTEVLNQLIENLTNTTVGGNVSYDGDQFTYVDNTGTTQTINFEELVQANETVTNLVYDSSTGVATYTNEEGQLQTLNLSSIVKNFETLTTLKVDSATGTLTYVDEKNVTNTLNLKDVVLANETVTTLVNNNNGTYTYTNEAGNTVTIDVPADVINNFEEIVTNTEVLNQLIENLTNTSVGGNVSYDGDQFTYVDNTGTTQTINFEELVQANETVTNLVYDSSTGVATYTNEEGQLQTLNLSSIVKNFETLTTLKVDSATGTLTYVDEKNVTNTLNLKDVVLANETVTSLVKNNNGTYTYTNEAGNTVTIDVPADVINRCSNLYQ